MKISSCVFFCLLLCSQSNAQSLSVEEFIKLRKLDGKVIDSIMAQKKFEKEIVNQNADYIITTYVFRQITGNSFVQRSLHVSTRFQNNIKDFDYGVWQKEDAEKIKSNLLKNGFKKKVFVSPIPNVDGTTFTTISYQKPRAIISYEEITQGSNLILYLFKINNKEYP